MKTHYKTARTTKEFKLRAFGYDLIIPVGSEVSNRTACGNDDNYRFWCDWHKQAFQLTKTTNSILAHDLNHRGINVPADHCAPYPL